MLPKFGPHANLTACGFDVNVAASFDRFAAIDAYEPILLKYLGVSLLLVTTSTDSLNTASG